MSLNLANTSENVCVQMSSACKSHVAAWITFYTRTHIHTPPKIKSLFGKKGCWSDFHLMLGQEKTCVISGPDTEGVTFNALLTRLRSHVQCYPR